MGAAQVRFVPTLAGQNHQRGGSQSLERMVRISSMNGPQSLELSVSITGIHRAAQDDRVRVLDRDEVILSGVRFLGATMWTDFAATGNPLMCS